MLKRGVDVRKAAAVGLLALLGVVAIAFAVQLYSEARRLDDAVEAVEQRSAGLEESLDEAEAEIERRRQEIAAAEALRRRAATEAARESLILEQAERQKLSAEEEAEFARLEAEAARQAAEKARREAEAELRRRKQEWSRLESALGATAPTSRKSWTLTVRLGEAVGSSSTRFNRRTRELLSRIAGAFLAHQGYRITLLGGGKGQAAAVEGYLEEAGLPPELVGAGSGAGELRLEVRETILGER